MNSHHLTEEEVALRRKEIMDEAHDRAQLGEPIESWVTIVWRGKVDDPDGRAMPALGPCRPADSAPAYLGQRRYTLLDVINGEFRL